MKVRFDLNQDKAWPAVLVALIGLHCSATSINAADERLWLDVKINGTPARIALDSGSDIYGLTADAAKRFGLQVTNFTADAAQRLRLDTNHIRWAMTETCLLNLQGTEYKTLFAVMNFPTSVHPDFDGLIGWSDLTASLVRIHASAGLVTFPKEVEEQLAGWTRLSVATNFQTLELEIPRTNGTRGILRIDTGSPMGVMLPARTWEVWRKSHPLCPVTVCVDFGISDGFQVQEESWATNITLGPLVITEVPVAQAPQSDEAFFGTKYEGKLGLAALKRLDLIVDGKRHVAHLRTKTTPPGPYGHNRAGVAFLPSLTNTDLFIAARVVEGSPAWEAGVRSGDTMLKCDGKPVSPLLVDPEDPDRLGGAPGTKLVLTLKRGSRTFDATVTLRQILPPASP